MTVILTHDGTQYFTITDGGDILSAPVDAPLSVNGIPQGSRFHCTLAAWSLFLRILTNN